MKECKAMEAKGAEAVMNEPARGGWEAVSAAHWSKRNIRLLITFSREKT